MYFKNKSIVTDPYIDIIKNSCKQVPIKWFVL